MDAELKEYLQGMEARMSATVEARIVESEARMKEHTETVETRLLSEFGKWARTTDMKARLQNNHVIGLEERIRELEFRRPV